MIAVLRLPSFVSSEEREEQDINNHHNKDGCKKVILTDEAWQVNDVNTCPKCKKSPVQLLFGASISKSMAVGECMLCGQLVAYKKNINSKKRSKNLSSTFNLGDRKMEVLNYFKMIESCACGMVTKSKKKKMTKKHNINQLALF